jgi:hypothetical protein
LFITVSCRFSRKEALWVQGFLELHFPSQTTLHNLAAATGDDDLVGETDYPMSPASSWLWCGKLRLIAGIFLNSRQH